MSDKVVKMYEGSCDYRTGPLPECAPLATSLTPMQQYGFPKYEAEEALPRGTLFPGLDLPFMNMANSSMPMTPQNELMALDFVTHELKLYLDTHEDDMEAFELFRTFLKLAKEGRKRYVEAYGPIRPSDMLGAESFTWLKAPWPWEFSESAGE